jgi:translocator protein
MNKLESPAIPKLVAAILVCEAAGGVGALATRDAIDGWYSTLRKPAFNPPNWVFGPVWTALYMLMGIALYRISTDGGKDSAIRRAQGLFAAQLALNAGWSFLFFGRRSPLYALVEIVLLWMTILFTIAAFFRISKFAGLLLVPYLLWTTFAAVLNLSIWRLND